ncbi:MAG: RIP metalloprotease RseP [Proteobacteria bacterium]|nr:RIP metalloprotease RseP [Pseudomonadota bacterium]
MDLLPFTTIDDWLIPFLLVLTLIVFVHEWGHYWLARRNGVRVEVFSIGFGPELFGWNDRHGTRWKVSALPLGGYVKMFGMVEDGTAEHPAEPLTPEDSEVSFATKRVGQRAAIVAGGPAANFLFAMVVLAGVAMTVGVPKIHVTVAEVMPNSAALAAGMKDGDIIRVLNGAEILGSRDVQEIISASPGLALPMTVERGGEKIDLVVTPKRKSGDSGERPRGLLGIKMQGVIGEFRRLNPAEAIWYGVSYTFTLSGDALANLGGLFIGKGNFKDLGGPIAIADFSGKAAAGGPLDLLIFMAVLSINLGLINLFPIPVLDGGHLAFMGCEAIRGRPLEPQTQEYGFRIGLILVLILMIAVTWNDLERLGVFKFLQSLVT